MDFSIKEEFQCYIYHKKLWNKRYFFPVQLLLNNPEEILLPIYALHILYFDIIDCLFACYIFLVIGSNWSECFHFSFLEIVAHIHERLLFPVDWRMEVKIGLFPSRSSILFTALRSLLLYEWCTRIICHSKLLYVYYFFHACPTLLL